MKQILGGTHRIFISVFWLILVLTLWGQICREFSLWTALGQAIAILAMVFPTAHLLSDVWLPRALARKTMKVFALQAIGMVLLQAFLMGLIEVLFYRMFTHGTLVDNPLKLSSFGTWRARFYSSIPSVLLINGTACGFRFYHEHNRIEKNHARLQQAHLEAQLRILQDQINPHLMFNVLNHIHILMQKNVELASVLLVKFSDILRYQLYECNHEFVLLEREVKYLKDLVAVEKIRWGEELNVDCIWNMDDGKRAIVPLLLVPFVENAFKHVSRLPSEKGFVNLVLKEENSTLFFVVENSSSAQQPRKNNGHGLGLENVRKRLDILYADRHELVIEKTANLFRIALTLQLKSNI
ncbi:sensor histidine kinase [Pedobacter nutrimenti]|uniref:GHKL domain-containing protein n=1 Tax=Pedobacter nutrimenti TaxID=1241337 RepID=A0A318UE82_9SPHI|nr:histidine kinase [Pedobacter nutrimenti]PYF74696.1 GHKL domain-containing protein [Pedobacter nutrimenti]